MAKNEIAPSVYGGLSRMGPIILSGLAFLTVYYTAIFWYFQDAESIFGLVPGPDFCPEDVVCRRPDLFAFQMTSFLAILVAGGMGFYGWHVSKRPHTVLPATPEGRIFGYLPEAELLAAVNFTFQFWDFFISLTIPEHRTPVMLTHHIMASTVSFCSVRYQYLHYYGIFFLGLSEVSSIFLVFVDLSRFFPPPPGSFFDQAIGTVVGPLFALSFLVYRVLLWWPVSLRLFSDARSVLSSRRAQQLRPGSSWVLYIFLGMNVPLGLLQLYWFTVILEEAQKALQ